MLNLFVPVTSIHALAATAIFPRVNSKEHGVTRWFGQRKIFVSGFKNGI